MVFMRITKRENAGNAENLLMDNFIVKIIFFSKHFKIFNNYLKNILKHKLK